MSYVRLSRRMVKMEILAIFTNRLISKSIFTWAQNSMLDPIAIYGYSSPNFYRFNLYVQITVQCLRYHFKLILIFVCSLYVNKSNKQQTT